MGWESGRKPITRPPPCQPNDVVAHGESREVTLKDPPLPFSLFGGEYAGCEGGPSSVVVGDYL